jgi:hypothetical protein
MDNRCVFFQGQLNFMLKFFKNKGVKYLMNAMNNNAKVNRVAEILDLKLEQGKINLVARLKGETESINISADYAIQNDAICFSKISSSKEWVNGLADIFKEKIPRINLNSFSKNGLAIKFFKQLL